MFGRICSYLPDLAPLYITTFITGVSVSLIAPFFPGEAAKKGMSTVVAGYVFATASYSICISNLCTGRILSIIRPKLLVIIGITLNGAANIIFGHLVYVNNLTFYTILCFACRAFEGIGYGLIITTNYSLVAKHCNTMGVLEASQGSGSTFGFIIGAVLYSIGGFALPFLIVGAAMLLNLPSAIRCVNRLQEVQQEKSQSEESSQNYKRLTYTEAMLMPRIILACCIVLIVSIDFASLGPILQVHLLSLNVSQTFISIEFMFALVFFTITSLFVGRWVKDYSNELIMSFGLLICAIALVLIDPSALFPFNKIYSSIGMSILGSGCAMAIIPSIPFMLRAAKSNNFDDNSSSAILSALRNTAFIIGQGSGNIIAGSLHDKVGFVGTTSILACFNIFLAFALGSFLYIRYCYRRCSEYEEFQNETCGRTPSN